MNIKELKKAIADGFYDEMLTSLYGEGNLALQKERYTKAADEFALLYGSDRDACFYSVPGRSEISGNHTDHNHGRVIAASIDLDVIAVASKNDNNTVNIKSEGFPEDKVDLNSLKPDPDSFFKSEALVAGVCDGFKGQGYNIGGFDAYTTSNVLKGSGLSSSAAFEVMVGNIMNHLYNDGSIPSPVIAKIAQYSENTFFGKPCGLMDQTACAVGGFVAIDFENTEEPLIEKLDFDLSAKGFDLCVINTGGNHADLNEDYASIPGEMKQVASYFGKPYLRGLTTEDIFTNINDLREKYGDRAVLRALHFIDENERVKGQTEALKNGDIDKFFEGIKASGDSSLKLLQNIFTTKNVAEQGLSLALDIARRFLRGEKGAWRVHGGGFAGTIQSFVSDERANSFKQTVEKVFGEGSCYILKVRKYGAIKL